MGYVDNFGVLATSMELARAGADAIYRNLTSKGLRVHAVETTDGCTNFLGLHLDLPRRRMGIKVGMYLRELSLSTAFSLCLHPPGLTGLGLTWLLAANLPVTPSITGQI